MPLMTVRQASARLGVSYSTLKHWIYKGSVRTVLTDGGHHRIRDTEVDRLLARRDGISVSPSRRKSRGPILMSISGRNRLTGVVEEVRRDGLLAEVRLRVGDQILTAVITRDAVDELRLTRGSEATAVIKATEVLIARQVPDSSSYA